jgi:hypothetical protein
MALMIAIWTVMKPLGGVMLSIKATAQNGCQGSYDFVPANAEESGRMLVPK